MRKLPLHPVYQAELERDAALVEVLDSLVDVAAGLSSEPEASADLLAILPDEATRRVAVLLGLILLSEDGGSLTACRPLLDHLTPAALTAGERYQLVECYSRIGRSYRQGQELALALDAYRTALPILDGLPPRPTTAALYHNIAVAHEQSGDHAAAAAAFDQAAAIEDTLGRRAEAKEERRRAAPNRELARCRIKDQVSSMIQAGAALRQKGNMADALQRFLLAQQQALRSGDADLIAMATMHVAGVFFHQNEHARAREILTAAMAAAPDHLNDRGMVQVRATLGSVLAGLDELDGAEREFQTALPVARANRWDESIDKCEYGLSQIAIERRDDETAHRLLVPILARRRKMKNPVLLGNALNQLGFVAHRLGRLEESRAYHHEALGIRRGRDLHGSGESVHTLAVIHEELGDRRLALAFYLRAVRSYEGIRRRISTGEESRASFLDKLGGEYFDAARLACELGRGPTAYRVLQRLQNRTLVDAIATASVPRPAGVAAGLFVKEAELLRQLRASAGHVLRAHDAARQLATLYTTEFHRAGRDYVRWRTGEPIPAPQLLATLERLGPGTAYLEVFEMPGPEGERTSIHRLGGVCARAGDRAMRPLQGSATVAGARPVRADGSALAAAAASRVLVLHDIRSVLGGPGPLFIVAHGPLVNVPLHALSAGEQTVIDWQPIRFLPHASFLDALQWLPEPSRTKAAVLADSLGDLPGARAEAVVAGRKLGASPRLGRSVTCSAVQEALCEADLVHIAGHAFFHAHDPMRSGLVASDGVVTAMDLRGLPMRASVVVLNACDSGVQGKGLGNEVSGFVRSLLLGGVRHVVCTLERVDDGVAREFAEELYRGLSSSSSDDIVGPVWRAQRHIAAAYRGATELWSPFILVG